MDRASYNNLVLLTRNDLDLLRLGIKAAVTTAARDSRVVLTIADAGSDSPLRDWLADRGSTALRYPAADSARKRLAAALASPSARTTFPADDVPFTLDDLAARPDSGYTDPCPQHPRGET